MRFWISEESGRPNRQDGIAKEFTKLARALRIPVPGGFYVLRHTHRTIADEVLDSAAAGLIMGHVDDGIAAVYRDRIDDARLRRVTEHVRKWLAKGERKTKKPRR